MRPEEHRMGRGGELRWLSASMAHRRKQQLPEPPCDKHRSEGTCPSLPHGPLGTPTREGRALVCGGVHTEGMPGYL